MKLVLLLLEEVVSRQSQKEMQVRELMRCPTAAGAPEGRSGVCGWSGV
jgi:hypothetical protein